jgi:putative acetyltransferase
MIEIRTERLDEIEPVRRVHEQAFGRSAEARLVEILRAANKALISLVAVNQGEVIGHILFSAVSISTAPQHFQAVGLAPVGVLPAHQRIGIGSTLIREGLERCKTAGYAAVVALGDPRYYSRFGFTRAIDHRLANEYGAHEEFMVLELQQRALAPVSGTVRYQPEFRESGC